MYYVCALDTLFSTYCYIFLIEKKAKQAEKQIREIARRAREEHRLSSNNMEIDTSYCNATMPGVPPGRQAVIDWFKAKEITRNATVDSVKRMQQPWFHGT